MIAQLLSHPHLLPYCLFLLYLFVLFIPTISVFYTLFGYVDQMLIASGKPYQLHILYTDASTKCWFQHLEDVVHPLLPLCISLPITTVKGKAPPLSEHSLCSPCKAKFCPTSHRNCPLLSPHFLFSISFNTFSCNLASLYPIAQEVPSLVVVYRVVVGGSDRLPKEDQALIELTSQFFNS